LCVQPKIGEHSEASALPAPLKTIDLPPLVTAFLGIQHFLLFLLFQEQGPLLQVDQLSRTDRQRAALAAAMSPASEVSEHAGALRIEEKAIGSAEMQRPGLPTPPESQRQRNE
jgi:hypothetical protein